MRVCSSLASIASLASLAFLLGACGGRAIETQSQPETDGGNLDSGHVDGSTSCGPRTMKCSIDNCGVPFTAVCIDGKWKCEAPTDDCTEPPACKDNPPLLACAIGCSGEVGGPSCIDGEWECPPVPPCPPPPPPPQDASVSDAGTLDCGNLSCNANISYCQISEGGAAPTDGGTGITYACVSLPSTCNTSQATCACVEALQGAGGCSCKDANGKVLVDCQYP